MAAEVLMFNPNTRERRRMYTCDVRELLSGDNSEGWVAYDPDLHAREAAKGVQPVSVFAPQGARGENLGAAAAEAGPVSKSAGFAPPIGPALPVVKKSSKTPVAEPDEF